jgi:hypothetical protein
VNVLMGWSTPLVLAANAPGGGQQGGQGQEFGSASPIALVVLVLFFVAVAFLARSMTKHLKRVPASFDPPTAESPTESSVESSAVDGPTSEAATPDESDQQARPVSSPSAKP